MGGVRNDGKVSRGEGILLLKDLGVFLGITCGERDDDSYRGDCNGEIGCRRPGWRVD